MSLARKILGNTFWQILGRAGTAVIAFITVGLLTNYWGAGNLARGQATYGTYATIYEFLAIFGSLADLGIFTIAVREMSKKKEQAQEIFSSTITLRVISLLMAMLLAIVAAFLVPQYQGTVIPRGVAIAAFGTGLFILSGTFSTILLVHLKMKFHALGLILGKIVTFACIAAVIFFTSPEPTEQSFYALIWTGVWGSALTLATTIFFTRRFLQLKPSWNSRLVKNLFLMALPFGAAIFLNTIYFRLDISMMGILLPRSAATGECLVRFCGDQQAGIYAVAVRITEVLIILPLYFMNSVLPSLSSAIAEKNNEQTQRRLSFAFLFLFLIAVPAVIGLFLLAKPIVELITPADFGSDRALQILTVPLFLTFFTTFLNFTLIAYGEQKKILWINAVAVVLNLLLNLIAIPQYGFMGAAVTSLLSEAFILAAGIFFVWRVVHIALPWKKIGGVLFSAILMGIVTFFLWRYVGAELGKKALVFVIPVSALVYAGGLWIFRVADQELIMLLKKQAPQNE